MLPQIICEPAQRTAVARPAQPTASIHCCSRPHSCPAFSVMAQTKHGQHQQGQHQAQRQQHQEEEDPGFLDELRDDMLDFCSELDAFVQQMEIEAANETYLTQQLQGRMQQLNTAAAAAAGMGYGLQHQAGAVNRGNGPVQQAGQLVPKKQPTAHLCCAPPQPPTTGQLAAAAAAAKPALPPARQSKASTTPVLAANAAVRLTAATGQPAAAAAEPYAAAGNIQQAAARFKRSKPSSTAAAAAKANDVSMGSDDDSEHMP